MLLQAFRASTEHGTNNYCMTDLCTDCKDSEKVAQHIESNSACFLPSQVLPPRLCRTCWRGTAWWGGWGEEGPRGWMNGKTLKWNTGFPLLLAHFGSSSIMALFSFFFFLFNRALICFLIPHSFSEQLQCAKHCCRYWRDSHEQSPSFCGAYILVGLSLVLADFILLEVLAGPNFFLLDRSESSPWNTLPVLDPY